MSDEQKIAALAAKLVYFAETMDAEPEIKMAALTVASKTIESAITAKATRAMIYQALNRK